MVLHHWPHRDTILKSKSYTYLKIKFSVVHINVPCISSTLREYWVQPGMVTQFRREVKKSKAAEKKSRSRIRFAFQNMSVR